jgi:hypothetical protein
VQNDCKQLLPFAGGEEEKKEYFILTLGRTSEQHKQPEAVNDTVDHAWSCLMLIET